MSLFAGLAGVVACGSFLAANDDRSPPASTSDSGAPDGEIVDGRGSKGDADEGDATKESGAGAGPSPRLCATTAPFSSPNIVSAAAFVDVRAVRKRKDTFFFAHVSGNTDNIDLGAASALTDGGVGSPHAWFGAVNGTGGQTIPAPTPDTLMVVFQQNDYAPLRKATRAKDNAAFETPTDLDITGAALDGDPVEPYITARNELYFATDTDKIYVAKLSGTSATFERELAELGSGGFPVVSDDGLEVFFMRKLTVQSVFHATRASDNTDFGLPVGDANLTTAAANTRPVWLSPDACTLYLLRTTREANEPPLALYIARRN